MTKPSRKTMLQRLIYQLKLMRKYSWMTFAIISFVVIGIAVSGTYLPWYFLGPKSFQQLIQLPLTGGDKIVMVKSIFNLTILPGECNSATESYIVTQELRSDFGKSLLQSTMAEVGSNFNKQQVITNDFSPIDTLKNSNDLIINYQVRASNQDGDLSGVIYNSTQEVGLLDTTVTESAQLPCFKGGF